MQQQNDIPQDVYVTTPDDTYFEEAELLEHTQPGKWVYFNYSWAIWKRGKPLPLLHEPEFTGVYGQPMAFDRATGFYTPLIDFGGFSAPTLEALERAAIGYTLHDPAFTEAWASSSFCISLAVKVTRAPVGLGQLVNMQTNTVMPHNYHIEPGQELNFGIVVKSSYRAATVFWVATNEYIEFARKPAPGQFGGFELWGPVYTDCPKHKRQLAFDGVCSICKEQQFSSFVRGLPCGTDDYQIEQWHYYLEAQSSRQHQLEQAEFARYESLERAEQAMRAIGLYPNWNPGAPFGITAPVFVNEDWDWAFMSKAPNLEQGTMRVYRQGNEIMPGDADAWQELCKLGYMVYYFVDKGKVEEAKNG